jgi:hypothetical protein
MLADFGHIHQKWRAIMSQSGPGKWLNAAKLLRPLVAQAHDILREHFEAGSSVEDYLRARAKLADSAVVGLLRIASILTGYVIEVWWLRSQRLRWVVTDERNWPLAPTLTCSFFSRKAAELPPEASRRQQRPASVQSSQASGISDSY